MSYTHLLRNVSLFAQLDQDSLAALAAEFALQSFRQEQVIFSQGSTTSSLYIVKSGKVQVTSFGRNNEITYQAIVEPGQYFGEFSLLDGLPRSGEAVAAVHSDLLVLNRPTFFRFLDRYPSVAVRLLVTVSRRMRFAESASEYSGIFDPAQKIARLLVEVAERYGIGEADEHGVRIGMRLTGDDLAALSGTTRDAASAVIEELHDAGLIALEGANIARIHLPTLRDRLGRRTSAEV